MCYRRGHRRGTVVRMLPSPKCHRSGITGIDVCDLPALSQSGVVLRRVRGGREEVAVAYSVVRGQYMA